MKAFKHEKVKAEVQEEMFGQSLSGVEIFRPGKWNGDEYSIEDLDAIISTFGKVGYDVPVKLGHSEEPGEPAYGWVESLSRIGDRLVANLRDLPDKIHQAIVDRQFDAVSSEIFVDLERGGERFPIALKAVALLGAEIPAVAGLKPLRDSLRGFSEAELASVRNYTFEKEPIMADPKVEIKEDNADELVELKAFADAQAAKVVELEAAIAEKDGGSLLEVKKLTAEIAELKKESAAAKAAALAAEIAKKVDAVKIPALREYMQSLYDGAYATTKTVKFATKVDGESKVSDASMVSVLDHLIEFINDHAEKSLFSEIGLVGDLRRDEEPRKEDAGEEVDRLTKLAMAKNSTSYSVAMKAVLSDPANAELKRAFAR